MVAYLFVEVEVRDEAALNEYLGGRAADGPAVWRSLPCIQPRRGCDAGGSTAQGHRHWRIPDDERLREWYASPEYAPARKLAPKAMDRRMLYLEGLPQS
jgi:uncharacterized protein (DUF1330 family)